MAPDPVPEGIEAPPNYVLERLLGRGAFGSVYLARDETLGRPVALKFLSVEGPSQAERFRREARFAARLEHPGIVRVYELGSVAGRPYIAMQFVDGAPLGQAAMERRALLSAVRAAADALGHAHTHGVVHRDVKPENVLVDHDGRAYVTDFGIARDVRPDAAATLSPEGSIIGTPALMAPEQARGDLRAIDARTDVYGLGATLYTVLTGAYPFKAENVVEVLHQVLKAPPPRPRDLDPSISESLQEITVRCMQKDPRKRYASMQLVIDDLDRTLDGDSVGPGGGSWFYAMVRARSPEPSTEGTDDDLALVVAVSHEIAAWDARLYRVSSNLPRTWPQLDSMQERLDRVVGARPDFALARFYRGLVHFRRGRLERALDDIERSIDRVRDMPTAHFELGRLYLAVFLREHELSRTHLVAQGQETHLGEVRNRLGQAAIAFEEARRRKTGLLDWQPRFATAVARLAEGDFAGSIEICDEVLAADPDLDEVWKLRGDAIRASGGDPCESYTRAAEVRRSFYEALLAKAEYELAQSRFAAGRATLETVLQIYPGHAGATAMLGRAWLAEVRAGADRGHLPDALSCADAAVAAAPDDYDATLTRAEVLLEMGADPAHAARLDEAFDQLVRAQELRGCPNRIGYLKARARLERTKHARTLGEDARPHFERLRDAMKALDHVPTPDSPWTQVVADFERLEAQWGDMSA